MAISPIEIESGNKTLVDLFEQGIDHILTTYYDGSKFGFQITCENSPCVVEILVQRYLAAGWKAGWNSNYDLLIISSTDVADHRAVTDRYGIAFDRFGYGLVSVIYDLYAADSVCAIEFHPKPSQAELETDRDQLYYLRYPTLKPQ